MLRDLDEGVHRTPRSVRLARLHREIHGKVLQLRQLRRRFENDGENVGTHLAPEVIAEIIAQHRRHLRLADETDPVPFEVGADPLIGEVEMLSLFRDEVAYRLQGEVRIRNIEAFPPIAQRRDPFQGRNPHAEELVEIRAIDSEELDALEKRDGGIRCLLQHSRIERQPTRLFAPELSLHKRSQILTVTPRKASRSL